ncbi:hypothetical protein HYU89_02915 [Candidatus Collierbacteria bacterium]|nr:hypothetical protein [Candidatus Collierbacteria bacterium]
MKFILFIMLLSVPAVWQIIAPGFFPMHDDIQVARVEQMFVALKSGQFPVRWVPDLGYGYGYPIFNFYNPLAYYFGAAFMFLGLDALEATKLMFIFPVLVSGISMFIFSKLFLSDFASGFAGLLYVYAAYHAVQIYVRGAVAEYWAYALLPLVFYAIWKRKIIFAGLTLAALIASHNLTAFMTIPFLVLLFLFRYFKISKLKNFNNDNLILILFRGMVPLMIGLGLSAFFWLPSILESPKTLVSQMVFEKFDPPSKHVVYPLQLWSGVWGYGGSSAGIDDGLSFQIGKIHLIGSLAAIAILLYCYIVKRKEIQLTIEQFNNLAIFSVVGLILSVFILLPLSRPIWDAFPVLSYIQFPWRFLTFVSLFSSLLTAWAITMVLNLIVKKEAMKNVAFIASCFLLLVSYIKFFQPQFKFPVTADELITREKLVWDYSRISYEYLPKGFIPPINAEVALRVDNKQNQLLVDSLKEQTMVRRVANIISLFTFITFIAFVVVIPFCKKNGQNLSS